RDFLDRVGSVSVRNDDCIESSFLDAALERSSVTEIVQVSNDPRATLRRPLRSGIGGAVIDDDDFEFLDAMRDQRLLDFPDDHTDRSLLVERRQQNRYHDFPTIATRDWPNMRPDNLSAILATGTSLRSKNST